MTRIIHTIAQRPRIPPTETPTIHSTAGLYLGGGVNKSEDVEEGEASVFVPIVCEPTQGPIHSDVRLSGGGDEDGIVEAFVSGGSGGEWANVGAIKAFEDVGVVSLASIVLGVSVVTAVIGPGAAMNTVLIVSTCF